MRKTVDILGIPVDSITMSEAVVKVGDFIEEGGVHAIFTPNAEIMMAAQRDSELRNILIKADMITADGAGVVLASKLLGCSVPEKVSGFDLVVEIFIAYSKRGLRCFLFGAKPGVAEEAAKKVEDRYSGVDVVGCQHGYFTAEQDDEIVHTINASNTDLLLVAFGAPRQEKWIYSHMDKLNAKVCIGVGGTIDILAGKAQLAPDFFRRNGLEWLYRLYKEPRRFIRMLDLPRFILRVLLMRITGGKKS